MILGHMRDIAQNFLGEKKVHKAVVTVPAYFNDSQRQVGPCVPWCRVAQAADQAAASRQAPACQPGSQQCWTRRMCWRACRCCDWWSAFGPDVPHSLHAALVASSKLYDCASQSSCSLIVAGCMYSSPSQYRAEGYKRNACSRTMLISAVSRGPWPIVLGLCTAAYRPLTYSSLLFSALTKTPPSTIVIRPVFTTA